MCGVIADEILTLRGSKDKLQITINITHAAIWLGCVATAYLNGDYSLSLAAQKKLGSVLPDSEQGWTDTLKYRATALYPTKKAQTWYSFHGSLNAKPVLESIGMDPNANVSTNEDAATSSEHTNKYSPKSSR